ncbi:MAG: hypothetical protein ACE5OR_03115 [bacterium]
MKRIILASAVIFIISLGYIGYSAIRNHGHSRNNSRNSIRNNDYISIRDHQEWADSYCGLVDIDVTLSSIPELNEVVAVTATFTVIKDLRDHEPTDEARITLPTGLKFVSQRGQSHSIQGGIGYQAACLDCGSS